MPFYYHETIDPTPIREKEVEYIRTMGEVVQRLVNTPGSDMRCVANWVVVWATGRWPQLIGQWEMRDFSWFIEHFRAFSLEVDHPEGFEQYRSGGFDRLLLPAPGTPTLDEILAGAGSAHYLLQETVTVDPGRGPEYLDALAQSASKIGDSRGLHLHGAYTVMLRNDSEVLVQWALDDVDVFIAAEATRTIPELEDWRRQALELERTHVGVLLKPTSWSPLR